MTAIDTNIFLYAVDEAEPSKQAKAKDLLRQLTRTSSTTVLLWQVATEYLAGLRRWASRGKFDPRKISSGIDEILALFPLAPPPHGVFRTSLRLSSIYQLSHWDSMLIAASIEAGVTTLYSEDLADGMTYESVTVINPLK